MNFQNQLIALTAQGSGSLGGLISSSTQTMTVAGANVYHFLLGAGTALDPLATVQMNIYDSQGDLVFSLTAGEGQTVSGDVLLAAGSYTIRYSSLLSLTSISYTSQYVILSEPLGPTLVAPVGSPPPSSTPSTSTPSSTTTSGSTTASPPATTTSSTTTTSSPPTGSDTTTTTTQPQPNVQPTG